MVLPSFFFFSWPFSFYSLGLIIVIIISEKIGKRKKKEEEEDLLHGASPSGCRDPWGRSSSHNMTDAIYLPRHKPDLFLIFSFFLFLFLQLKIIKKKSCAVCTCVRYKSI